MMMPADWPASWGPNGGGNWKGCWNYPHASCLCRRFWTAPTPLSNGHNFMRGVVCVLVLCLAAESAFAESIAQPKSPTPQPSSSTDKSAKDIQEIKERVASPFVAPGCSKTKICIWCLCLREGDRRSDAAPPVTGLRFLGPGRH